MPSGHTEAIALFTGLLYLYKLIPLWVCILAIILMGIQRIFINMHSLSQVLVGGLAGILYAFVYKKYTYGFTYVVLLTIGLYII